MNKLTDILVYIVFPIIILYAIVHVYTFEPTFLELINNLTFKEYFTIQETEENKNCVCAYDIDSTITLELQNAAKAIEECKSQGCHLAIITARPMPYYADINTEYLGIPNTLFKDDFYYGSVTDVISADRIAKRKVAALNDLSDKYNSTKERTILFDDNVHNIFAANVAGYSTIIADKHGQKGGLPDDVVEKIKNIL